MASPCETVPQEIKLISISLLITCLPQSRLICLCFAAADTDVVVARLATTMLIDLWGSPEGCVPPDMQAFAMLNMSLLFHLCNMSAAFQWPTQVDFSVYENEIDALQEELDALELPHDTMLKKTIELKMEGIGKLVDNIIERRLRSLQNLVNHICGLLNLPNPQLDITQGSFMAAYGIGRGRIKVTSKLFLDDEPLSIEMMSTLLHEIGHMEQDTLVIRLMCDDLCLIFGQHSKLLRPLLERYADAVGYAPDPMFLMAVLRLRDDKPLSQEDRVRAARLIDASYQTENGHHTGRLIEARMEHLERVAGGSSVGFVRTVSCSQLFTADRRSIESLFKQGQIPAVVLDEIAECQIEFVKLSAQISQAKL